MPKKNKKYIAFVKAIECGWVEIEAQTEEEAEEKAIEAEGEGMVMWNKREIEIESLEPNK